MISNLRWKSFESRLNVFTINAFSIFCEMSTVKYLKTDAASCYFFYIFVEKDVVGKMF